MNDAIFVLISIIGITTFIVVVRLTISNRDERRVQEFLSENSKYGKVYLKIHTKVDGRVLGIERIDDDKSSCRKEGEYTVYYVKPGEHILKMFAGKVSVNPFTKSVPTIKDEVSVTVENGQSYEMAFDFDEESYSIKKI